MYESWKEPEEQQRKVEMKDHSEDRVQEKVIINAKYPDHEKSFWVPFVLS